MHSSRTPRRRFAAPLVMTIAALPACVVSSKPVGTTTAGGDTTTTTHDNPPRPDGVDHRDTPDQQAPDSERTWTVSLEGSGACTAMGATSCPEGASCNPPPPAKVDCPAGITAGQPVQIWAKAGETDCYVAIAAGACPAKATCNPPPPQKTACPQ